MEKTIEIKDGDDICGNVTITRVDDGPAGEGERKKGDPGAMVFEYAPKKKEDEKKTDAGKGERKEPKGECCSDGGAGWIQHVRTSAAQDWSYDNGTKVAPTGTTAGKGGDSDPALSPQPTKTGDKGFTTAPWYGSPYKKDDPEFKFAKNPLPQTTMGDLPGGRSEFRTQLVCVKTGKILLDWEWKVSREEGTSELKRDIGGKHR